MNKIINLLQTQTLLNASVLEYYSQVTQFALATDRNEGRFFAKKMEEDPSLGHQAAGQGGSQNCQR